MTTSKSEQWINETMGSSCCIISILLYINIHLAFKTSRSPVSFLGIVFVCVYLHEHWPNIPRILQDSWNNPSPELTSVDTSHENRQLPKRGFETLFLINSWYLACFWRGPFYWAAKAAREATTNNQPPPTSQPTTNQQNHPCQSFFLKGLHVPQFLLPQVVCPLTEELQYHLCTGWGFKIVDRNAKHGSLVVRRFFPPLCAYWEYIGMIVDFLWFLAILWVLGW